MFDYRVSKQTVFNEACKNFALRHNVSALAKEIGINPQTLRNKLNPEQVHQLTCLELLVLTDLTEDAVLLDGLLAQINCLPSVPVNEVAEANLATYTLQATAAVGSLAAEAIKGGSVTAQRKSSLLDSVNAGIRHLSLVGVVIQSRLQASPTLASTVDTLTGIAAVGLG